MESRKVKQIVSTLNLIALGRANAKYLPPDILRIAGSLHGGWLQHVGQPHLQRPGEVCH